MIVRGHCGDWSVHSCVVDECTRRSSEWQHLLAVVWYCVLASPLQRLSTVTACVINVTMRCWEMPQPTGGSNGGAWGQSWRFISGRPTTHCAQTSRRLALLEQKGHQIQSVTYHSLHSLSRTVCFRTCLSRALKLQFGDLVFLFSPQCVGGGGVSAKGLVSLHLRVFDGVSVLYLLSLARAMTSPEQSGLRTASREVGRRCFAPS